MSVTRIRFAFLAAALVLLAGCAHSRPIAVARACANPAGATAVCKHCNCLMPADAPPDGTCTVCNCGYRNAACVRGHNP